MKPFSLEKRHKKIIEIDFLKNNKGKTDPDFFDDYLNINAINLDLNENIYRIFNWDYFINDLKNNKLTLMHPHEWQDPFEFFLLNSRGQLPDGRLVGFEPIRDSYYGQCWSLKDDCDGIWRNFKGSNNCVLKAKATSKKLFEVLYNINDPFHYISYFIGKVDYVTDDTITDFFKERINLGDFQSGIEFATTLLIKRHAYAYEEEVRIIVHKQGHGRFYQTNINPNLLYDELILDPWLKPDEFENKKIELRNAGFTGKISRSSLYDKPFFVAKL